MQPADPASPPIVRLAECPSTQDEVRRLAEGGAPAFTAVRADLQTAGRGRRGRAWVTPPGSALLSSILLRPARPVEELPALALVGGVAACEVARSYGVPAALAWPNDVVVNGRKLAGVLPELIDGPAVVLGVGMNVRMGAADLPPVDRLAATSLLLEGADPPPEPDAVLGRLLGALRPLSAAFDRGGFAAIAPRARELDALCGAHVSLRLAGGGSADGVAEGIADDGALLVRTAGGVEAHRSGEVERVVHSA